MKKLALIILLLFAGSPELLAKRDRDVRPVGKVLDTVPLDESRTHSDPRPGERFKPPGHRPGKPGHPIYPGYRPPWPGQGPLPSPWPATTTIVREVQPVIIVNTPPAADPPAPPEPQKVWVPPVMDTRVEPGYWDYGIRKVWMGDHWRYEQDFDRPTWVPEREVRYVRQEGYWSIVEE